MTLSLQITTESLNDLTTRYSEELSSGDIQSLEAINKFAAEEDIPLNRQSPTIINYMIDQIKTTDENPATIYQMVVNKMNEQSAEIRQLFNDAGRFNGIALYHRDLHDQMQDHDMRLVMPGSSGNIDVLAVVNQSDDASIDAVSEGLRTAINDATIQHIMVPVGPGHWRGAYLTKPTPSQPRYQLELFDPYGPAGANAITTFILSLLQQYGIDENQITIDYSGPTIPQQDGYACGDFTCAYSHKKMNEWGADVTAYNSSLIETLEHSGNKNDMLRKATRRATGESPEASFTPHEKCIFDATISEPNDATEAYKREIASLLNCRQTIFAKADAVSRKEAQNLALNDEELSVKLQAEEFTLVGLNGNM